MSDCSLISPGPKLFFESAYGDLDTVIREDESGVGVGKFSGGHFDDV